MSNPVCIAPTDSALSITSEMRNWRSTSGVAAPASPTTAVGGNAGVVEGDDAEAAGHVDGLHGGAADTGRRRRDEHLGDAGLVGSR